MIRKDNVTGHLWFNDESDDDNQHDAINLTELFGKGKEPQTDEEVIAIIKEKQKFFKA